MQINCYISKGNVGYLFYVLKIRQKSRRPLAKEETSRYNFNRKMGRKIWGIKKTWEKKH